MLFMNRLIFLLFVSAIIPFAALAVENNPPQKVNVHKITSTISTEEYLLPNGLSVFLTVNKFAPSVHVGHWVKAGSLHEKPGITGIAHLFEHMMFRPLKPGQPSYADQVSKLGADYNASTRFESTYYYASVPQRHLTKLLEIESNRFKNLVVTDDLLNVERKAVWSEYSTKFDANPVIDLWFQIYQKAYVGHPLGWMIVGFREDLEKIKAQDCNEFFQSYYRPNNVGLFISGNFDSKKVLKEVVQMYGDWKPGKEAALPQPFTQKTAEIVAEGKLPSAAQFVLFGFRTPYFDKSNALIQTLANSILFDSKNGLLKKRVVDSRKLASDASDFNFSYDNGMLKAGVTLLPSATLDDLKKEIAQLKSDFLAMSEEEFQTFKRQLYISVAEDLQRNASLAESLASTWGKYGDINITRQLISNNVNVEKKQIVEFLNTHFIPENFVYMKHKSAKSM